jgi:hypothetical protein
MADFSQTTAWGRGLESDLSWARAELMQVKAELERVRLIAHDNKQALYNAKAEVERLTKAGDAMQTAAKIALQWGTTQSQVRLSDACTDWNASKEGKQL